MHVCCFAEEVQYKGKGGWGGGGQRDTTVDGDRSVLLLLLLCSFTVLGQKVLILFFSVRGCDSVENASMMS